MGELPEMNTAAPAVVTRRAFTVGIATVAAAAAGASHAQPVEMLIEPQIGLGKPVRLIATGELDTVIGRTEWGAQMYLLSNNRRAWRGAHELIAV